MELALAVAMGVSAYIWHTAALRNSVGITKRTWAAITFLFAGLLLWKFWHTL
jgi:hypothetical protein